jgi:DNA polymerase family A/3'-5' exonuclease
VSAPGQQPLPFAPQPTPIRAAYLRARLHKVEAAIRTMAPLGVAARWSGADFELSGLNNLAPADRELIEKLQPQIARHLAEPGADDPEHLLDVLDIEVEVVDDPEQARRVIAELPRSIGLDIETQPRIPGPPPALRLTKSGRRYVDQPPADTSGDALSPFRARVRLVQAYDPNKRVAFIFDMQTLRFDDLSGLFDRQVLAHSMFEAMLLGAQGIELPHLVDTVQLASLRLGAAHGVRKLGNVAHAELGIDLPKDQGASYWAAKNLSDQQLVYAGTDAAVCYLAGKEMWRQLGARERKAFELANRAVPAIARMRLRGLPFDPAAHAETMARWQAEYAEAREAFRELTGGEVPAKAPDTRAWLAARLPAEAIATWARTRTGLLSVEAAELTRMALEWPEIRPLVAVRKAEKKLTTFGQSLLDMIEPSTGRLHGDYFLPTVSGRLSCRRPNLQQLTGEVKAAVIRRADSC